MIRTLVIGALLVVLCAAAAPAAHAMSPANLKTSAARAEPMLQIVGY